MKKNLSIIQNGIQSPKIWAFLSSFRVLQVLIFLSLIGLSCTKVENQELPIENGNAILAEDSWEQMFELLWHDQTILVPAGNSIQEAVDAAQPGDAILVEAGYYDEQVNVDRGDISIIGVPSPSSSSVELSHGVSGRIGENQVINIKAAREGYAPYRSLEHITGRTTARSGFRVGKEVMPNGIAHYTFLVRVGGHKQEVIRLHRVVRELRPGKTAPTNGAVFMVHGSSQGFEDIFLYPGTEAATTESSCPVYLANNHLDVWGIDLAWTRLPPTTTDFSLMEDWDINREIHHTLQGMGVARIVRLLTGHGFDRLNLLGFSYGGLIGYVAAGKETQEHSIRRDIKGLIPVDFGLKFAPEETAVIKAACNRLAATKEQFEQGIFHNNSGQAFSTVGTLALTDPEGASPIIPNFTNYQAAFFLGTHTFLQPNPNSPTWHFIAANITAPTEITAELAYTDPKRWLKLASDLPFFMPQVPGYEYHACICGEEEVDIDDYLDQISVPIFYLGAAGGTGQSGLYTTGLTASTDISNHIVMLKGADAPFADFGHADLFMARDAADLAWSHVSDWLLEH